MNKAENGMYSVRICDGREAVYQWDVGVEIELEPMNATEIHFVAQEGIIKRTPAGNRCVIPDACLMRPGTLAFYAFYIGPDSRITKHKFGLYIRARPKPADYVDPPAEASFIELVTERLKSDDEFLDATRLSPGALTRYG